MALREGGGAIVALGDGIHALDFDSGAVTPLALLAPADPEVQLADGKVDRAGRFVFGTSHRKAASVSDHGAPWRFIPGAYGTCCEADERCTWPGRCVRAHMSRLKSARCLLAPRDGLTRRSSRLAAPWCLVWLDPA